MVRILRAICVRCDRFASFTLCSVASQNASSDLPGSTSRRVQSMRRTQLSTISTWAAFSATSRVGGHCEYGDLRVHGHDLSRIGVGAGGSRVDKRSLLRSVRRAHRPSLVVIQGQPLSIADPQQSTAHRPTGTGQMLFRVPAAGFSET
jgi:hypothetical protein